LRFKAFCGSPLDCQSSILRFVLFVLFCVCVADVCVIHVINICFCFVLFCVCVADVFVIHVINIMCHRYVWCSVVSVCVLTTTFASVKFL
jgi:hypothetical protein